MKITESEYLSELSALMKDKRVFDEKALTASELARIWGYGRTTAKKKCEELVADKKLERVWKKLDNGYVAPAYRPKKSGAQGR